MNASIILVYHSCAVCRGSFPYVRGPAQYQGFSLYQEGRFRESLEYFKASYTKDPAYSYAHYNYVCVGSVLHTRDDRAGLYVPELEYHLLTAMRLAPRYRLKWHNDPDLAWYRKELENKNPHKPQRALKHSLNSFNERDLRRIIVREDDWYILSSIGSGCVHLKLRFFTDGFLRVIYCLNDRIDISPVVDLGDGA